MSDKVDLKIDWASHKAAKYACENWHYSKVIPVGKLVKVGVWENDKFIGVVLFGRGANPQIGKPFGLTQTQVCELVRVALTKHLSPVSKIIGIALKFLKKKNVDTRLVISYADSEQGHNGIIYQAGNWIYDNSSSDVYLIINGKKLHRKSCFSLYHTSSVDKLKSKGLTVKQHFTLDKHRYLMPLDKDMRKRIIKLAKPYPKRSLVEEQQKPSVDGGATPT